MISFFKLKSLAIITVLLLSPVLLSANNLDLTKSLPKNLRSDYLLGPTGMRGWIFTDSRRVTSQDVWTTYSTSQARQILVTQVDPDSPADGAIKIGDVILGIGNEKFSRSSRIQLGNAIDEAEKMKNKGHLQLLVWRPKVDDFSTKNKRKQYRSEGSIQTITVKLRVMGEYSPTAPFNCKKTDTIRKETIAVVMKENLNTKLQLPMLALLASGDEIAMRKAKASIKKMGRKTSNTDDKNIGNQSSWFYGYSSLILSEYYLLTKDDSVLAAIRSKNEILAKGQSITGDWGQRMAGFEFNNGSLHGRLRGYAALNHPSLTCYYALVLGKKCGVESPKILRAIKKSTDNFSRYINKGAIAYGYHSPLDQLYTNNGMSGMAALIFDVQGNKEGARFFALQAAAAAHMIETGHTGPFFNVLWTPLGTYLGGPELTTAYLKRWRWLQTMSRRWDGGFLYQEPSGGSRSYRGLSASAAHLMYLSLPQRKLITTGRESDTSAWVTREKAEEIAGIARLKFKKMKIPELLEKASHELPPIRIAAAKRLATKPLKNNNFLPDLIKMLSGHYNEKVGACYTLRLMKKKSLPAMGELMNIVRDSESDDWLRQSACRALSAIGAPAIQHLPELVDIYLNLPIIDQRRELEHVLGMVIVRMSKASKTKGLNKKNYIKVAKKLLKHPHHEGRIFGMFLIDDIAIEDLHLVAEEIVEVIKNDSQEYTSYTQDFPRKQGLEILERLNIQEGLDLTVATLDTHLWGQKYRVPSRLKLLEKYGANAKKYLPELRKKLKGSDIIEKIEMATKVRKLISLKDAIAIGAKIPK